MLLRSRPQKFADRFALKADGQSSEVHVSAKKLNSNRCILLYLHEISQNKTKWEKSTLKLEFQYIIWKFQL